MLTRIPRDLLSLFVGMQKHWMQVCKSSVVHLHFPVHSSNKTRKLLIKTSFAFSGLKAFQTKLKFQRSLLATQYSDSIFQSRSLSFIFMEKHYNVFAIRNTIKFETKIA